VEGRAFSKMFPADSTESVIINQSTAKLMGFKNPLGKKVYFDHPAFPEKRKWVKIIGVVKDFHFRSLHSPMGPFIFRMYRPWEINIFVKIKPDNVKQTIAGIQTVTKNFAPEYPFEYEFMDDSYNRLYLMENKISDLFNVFAALAIIISCLGLFGLAAYTVERRTKEIGIRKVFGATIPEIMFLLSKEFSKWIIIANIIAWPLAYYIMSNWLKDFAYRINIGIGVFLLSGAMALLIALITVGAHTIKAATSNPVDALRYE
jgi:putative ABC transport system permease protein